MTDEADLPVLRDPVRHAALWRMRELAREAARGLTSAEQAELVAAAAVVARSPR